MVRIGVAAARVTGGSPGRVLRASMAARPNADQCAGFFAFALALARRGPRWPRDHPGTEPRYRLTSAINACRFPSVSSKSVNHSSWSGMSAILCGESRKDTPRPTSSWYVASRSSTLK